MAYPIKLQTFEGPLDLLLHLIDQAEVDIYDIPIAEITDQYLEYLYNMQEFKIDIASEFLVMAATLLAIKSKMLLPKHEDLDQNPFADIVEDEVDPREELIQRLLEYKRFKAASEGLKQLEFERNQVYTRPPEDLSHFQHEQDRSTTNYNVSILQLFVAFQSIIKKHRHEHRVTTITKEEISVTDKMAEILWRLSNTKGTQLFSQLFSSLWSRTEVVVTFLALLELIKQKKVTVLQSVNFEDIEISTV